MKLYEFEGKRLFESAGIKVPRGTVVSSAEQAQGLVGKYGSVMVKAQTLWGKRGRKGAVVACRTEEEVAAAAASLLGRRLDGEVISTLLVEEELPVVTEAYLGVTYSGRMPTVILSRHGGVDIEELSRQRPEDVMVSPVNILKGLDRPAAEALAQRAGFGEEAGRLADIVLKLYRMFVEDDALLCEVNPLIEAQRGEWYAADAKVEIDDDAGYRLRRLALPDRTASGLPLTELQRLALENDRRDTRGTAGRMFYELAGGNIIVLASGGGTSVEALDHLYLLGGKPAVFTEYSGNPTAERVKGLTKIALMYPGPVDAVWAVGGRANFTDIYETLVNGVMVGICETEGFDKTIPIVVRRAGPRDDEAFDALHRLRQEEGYNIFLRGTAISVADSARMVVRQAARHMERQRVRT
jgi:succinyl-CoA synthetase beta subunit